MSRWSLNGIITVSSSFGLPTICICAINCNVGRFVEAYLQMVEKVIHLCFGHKNTHSGKRHVKHEVFVYEVHMSLTYSIQVGNMSGSCR